MSRTAKPNKNHAVRCASRLRRGLAAAAIIVSMALFALSLLPLPSIAMAQTTATALSETLPSEALSSDTLPSDTLPSETARSALEISIEGFLREQTASLGDQVTISVPPIGAALENCPAPEPFLPRPGTPTGRVTVGVNCDGERTRYVQAQVTAIIRHLVTRQALSPGEAIDADMLDWQESDAARLRRGYLDQLEDVIGKVAQRRIPQGAVLTQAMVRLPWLVERGDTVTLTAAGQGFRIARQVEALENGGLGSMIRLKTDDNQILQGRVDGMDSVAIAF